MGWTRATCLWVTALALGACATTAQFRNGMDGFLGEPISRAEDVLGYHYKVRNLEAGQRAYTWLSVKRGVTPGYQSPTTIETFRTRGSGTSVRTTTVNPGMYVPPTAYEVVCEYTLITDPSGTVIRWNARGKGCRGWPPSGQVLQSEPAAPPRQ